MREMYAVKVDLVIEGHGAARYVGRYTRLADPSSYVSSYSARLWKRKGGAEGFITKHAGSLPAGARVVTISA